MALEKELTRRGRGSDGFCSPRGISYSPRATDWHTCTTIIIMIMIMMMMVVVVTMTTMLMMIMTMMVMARNQKRKESFWRHVGSNALNNCQWARMKKPDRPKFLPFLAPTFSAASSLYLTLSFPFSFCLSATIY